jgi:hypothetical protein
MASLHFERIGNELECPRPLFSDAAEVGRMTHSLSRVSRHDSSSASGLARHCGLLAAALCTTAAVPGGARAGSGAAMDSATVTIRVSVSPYYSLMRVSSRQILRDDGAEQLCVASNAPAQSLPITGVWIGRTQQTWEFALPSCEVVRSQAALRSIMPTGPGGSLLVVRPE